MRKQLITIMMLIVITAALLAGCGSPSQSAAPVMQPVALTVSVASSLKDSMEEIKTQYGQDNSAVTLTYNFGASGALQQQIEQGAPTDLFISAATGNMDALIKKGLIVNDSRKDLLLNKVVLIVPADSAFATDFQGLTDPQIKKIALGEPESVPAGKYGQEILTKLGVWEQAKSKAVYAKDARQVLTYVATGNVDAGVVYSTDAKTTKKVKVLAEAASDLHTPVIYPLAVVKNSKNQQAAMDFAAYLAGDKAKAVFEKYGFTVIKK